MTHLAQSLPSTRYWGVPTSEADFRRARLDPWTTSRCGKRVSLRGDHWESEAQSFRSDPLGGCSESEARSYAAGPGFGGWEPSRFLGTKRWKSQKLRQLLPEHPTEWKASEGVLAQLDPDHLLRRGNAANIAPTTPYPRHSPRVQTRRTQRSNSRFLSATRVSWRAVHRQLVCPLRPKPRRGCFSGGSVRPCSSSIASSRVSNFSSVTSHDRLRP